MTYNADNYHAQGGARWVVNGEIDQLDVTFVVGAEAGNVINVGIQLNKPDGSALDRRQAVLMYLSDDANGDTLATTPDGGFAIGTDGLAIEVLANQAAWLIAEADGDVDVDINESGAATFYMVVVKPDGRLAVSDAITFAA